MCLSEADNIVMRALPVLSSFVNLLARLFASIVPPIPPPTIRIFIFVLLLISR